MGSSSIKETLEDWVTGIISKDKHTWSKEGIQGKQVWAYQVKGSPTEYLVYEIDNLIQTYIGAWISIPQVRSTGDIHTWTFNKINMTHMHIWMRLQCEPESFNIYGTKSSYINKTSWTMHVYTWTDTASWMWSAERYPCIWILDEANRIHIYTYISMRLHGADHIWSQGKWHETSWSSPYMESREMRSYIKHGYIYAQKLYDKQKNIYLYKSLMKPNKTHIHISKEK